MDTLELLLKLQRGIAETTRDRDRLQETVISLEGEITRIEGEHELVAQLVSKFTGEAPSSSTDRPGQEITDVPITAALSWPMSPVKTKKIKAKKAKAWARYKFDAADWYLGTLREIDSREGGLKRVLGVQMAVDGVIQSLCSAFDAAVFALYSAVERTARIPHDRRTSVDLASWSKLATLAKFLDIDLACALSISSALVGEYTELPVGWLAQLQSLRGRRSCQDLLVDAHPEGRQATGLCIEVPGGGLPPLMHYLAEARDRIGELLETIFHDLDDLKRGRIAVADIDQLRARAERSVEDLFPHADLSDN